MPPTRTQPRSSRSASSTKPERVRRLRPPQSSPPDGLQGGRLDVALGVWTDLSASRNPFRVQALEALAKHYEHRERNHAMALEMTRSAIELEETPELKRREQRLRQRLEKRRNRLPGC